MMALLLDTQVIIWMEENESRISDRAKSTILSVRELYLSEVSVWEMAIKIRTGKLSLKTELSTFIENFLNGFHCNMLDIGLEHIYYTLKLPFHHQDPFDRLLIAQSLVENFPIAGSDTIFDNYGVNRIW